MLALYPNTSTLRIDYETDNQYLADRLRTSRNGYALANLKTLHIHLATGILEYQPNRPLSEAEAIMDSLNAPALEHITIQVKAIDQDLYFRGIRELEHTLCMIRSSPLEHVCLHIDTMYLYERPGSCFWVSRPKHCRGGTVLKSQLSDQTAIEHLIMAVLQRIAVTRFSISLTYDISRMEDSLEVLLLPSGFRLSELLVPNQERLLESVKFFKAAQYLSSDHRRGRGFEIEVNISGRHHEQDEVILIWRCSPLGCVDATPIGYDVEYDRCPPGTLQELFYSA
jgi:hypothetical protein